MKLYLYTAICALLLFSAAPMEKQIDPTGTYQLGKKRKPGKEVYAYFGQITVKALSKSEIIVICDVNSGAPGYNSGFFKDTLAYAQNRAVFTTPDDSSCKITLDFSKKGVTVKQEAADLNFSCGFGQGVVIDDFFKKKSSKELVFDD